MKTKPAKTNHRQTPKEIYSVATRCNNCGWPPGFYNRWIGEEIKIPIGQKLKNTKCPRCGIKELVRTSLYIDDIKKIIDAAEALYKSQGFADLALVSKMSGIPPLVAEKVMTQYGFSEMGHTKQFNKQT